MHLKKALHRLNRTPARQTKGSFRQAFIRFRDHRFANAVRYAFEHRYSTVLTAICAFMIALTLLTSGRVGFEFFPSPESAVVFGNVDMTPGTPRDRTAGHGRRDGSRGSGGREQADRRSGRAYQFPDTARSVPTRVARAKPQIVGDHLGGYTVELIPGDHRDIRTRDFIAAWKEESQPACRRRKPAGIMPAARPARPGRDIDLRLHGAPLDVLKEVAIVRSRRYRTNPGAHVGRGQPAVRQAGNRHENEAGRARDGIHHTNRRPPGTRRFRRCGCKALPA